MFHQAVGSCSSCPLAARTVGTQSTGGFSILTGHPVCNFFICTSLTHSEQELNLTSSQPTRPVEDRANGQACSCNGADDAHPACWMQNLASVFLYLLEYSCQEILQDNAIFYVLLLKYILRYTTHGIEHALELKLILSYSHFLCSHGPSPRLA